MCKGSLRVSKSTDAAQGATFKVGTVTAHDEDHTRVGALFGDDKSCVQCVLTGQRLTLIGIPEAIQREYGIGAVELATFQQKPWNLDDVVALDRGPVIGLAQFAQDGVRVYTGELANTANTVRGLLDTANEVTAIVKQELIDA